MILDLSYIQHPVMTGKIENDVLNLLNANNCRNTAEHCIRVAETCVKLAKKFKVDIKTAYYSGLLHDISAIIKPIDMLGYAESNGWYIDKSERKHNFIFHQRISAIVANEYYHIFDKNILSAIECHSTLKANPSEYDMILFLSDKISWDQKGIPPFLSVLEASLDTSLMFASLTYIQYAIDNNMILLPHKWLVEAKAWLEKQCT